MSKDELERINEETALSLSRGEVHALRMAMDIAEERIGKNGFPEWRTARAKLDAAWNGEVNDMTVRQMIRGLHLVGDELARWYVETKRHMCPNCADREGGERA